MRLGRRRAAVLAAVLIAAALGLSGRAADLVLAGRMLLAVRTLAAGSPASEQGVERVSVHRPWGERSLEAVLYRPSSARPERAVVLVAGVSELGCFHPRLVALAHALARMGFAVLTPDIAMFRRYEVAPGALEELAFWTRAAPSLAEAPAVRQVGIIGISFSGTLAVMTAARPELRDSVRFVLAIGPYDDLAGVARGWFAPGPITVEPGRYPTRAYGKWIVMLQALDALPEPHDRAVLDASLRSLLAGRTLPPAAGLGTEGGRWLRLAVGRETESDPELARAIEAHLARYYARMSPAQAAAEVRCPVFLAHGAFDDLIPSDESRRLAERLPGRARLLVSPLLTHTHPLDRPLGWRDRLGAAAGMAPFFYALARAAR